MSTSDSWLPAGFVHPERAQLTEDVHLRPIAARDADLGLIAVASVQPRLWRMYGTAWGWPPVGITREQEVADLQHHADEMDRHESFNYAIFPTNESELLGCLYIDPVETDDPARVEAEVSWWLIDKARASLQEALDAFAHQWLREHWPFTHVHTPFQDSGA